MATDELYHGQPHQHMDSLENAKKYQDSAVVFFGDWGGQVMAAVPVRLIQCNQRTLERLLIDLGSLEGWEDNGLSIHYVIAPPATSIPGGMGGGKVTDGVFVHADFMNEVGFDISPMVQSVLAGHTESLLDMLAPGIINILHEPANDKIQRKRRWCAMSKIKDMCVHLSEPSRVFASAVPLLVEAVDSGDPNAIAPIASMPWAAEQTVPSLLNLLVDPRKYVRQDARDALRSLGAAVFPMAAELSILLSNPEPRVQVYAVQILVSCGAPISQAVPVLLRLLECSRVAIKMDVRDAFLAMTDLAKPWIEDIKRLAACGDNTATKKIAQEILVAHNESAEDTTK